MRRAGAGDSPALALVAAATFLDAFAGVLSGADIVAHCAANSSTAKFAQWLEDGVTIISIAEAANGAAPLGYTVLTVPDLPIDPLPGDVELKRIYTLSRVHGSGLGPALMARAIEDAQRAGHRRILLGVYGANSRARAFYERQRFVLAGTRRFLVGQTWHDDVVYARPI
jgi:GNAT superfamily N-acetyltransferase